jgi:hypothetical protein
MHTRKLLIALIGPLGLFCLAPSLPAAALDYYESLPGDLSNSGSAPTALTFDLGVNRVTGTMGGNPNNDPDIYTFTIQPGWQLTSIVLAPMNPRENSFYAFASGATIETTSAQNHLASHLTRNIGELMPDLAAGGNFGGQGFTAPLGAGTYTAWFQETSNVRVDYTFSYTVTAIPEPSATAALTGLVGLGFTASRRRRA